MLKHFHSKFSPIFRHIKFIPPFLNLKTVITVFCINSVCAFFKALYQLSVAGSSFDVFLTTYYGYFIILNLYGFAMVIAYICLSKGPDIKMPLSRIIMVGLLAFLLSYPFTLTIFSWEKSTLPAYLQAAIYLIGTLLISVWALIVIIYIKSREAQPHFLRLKQQIAEQSEERARIEMELHLLQAQIEPHFLFNTLANLHNLIDMDPQKAKILLEQLTDYLRVSIPQFRHKFIYLEEEISMINHYLNIQKVRFSNRLNFTISIDQETKKWSILPMSILTLVENSIKHGIEKNKKMGHITIRSEILNKETLMINVVDNAGLFTQQSQGTGLSNLTERLNIAYSSAASLSIECTPEVETRVTLKVPIHG